MKKESKFISNEEILPEEKETTVRLEANTDELYRMKVESQSLLDKIIPYLPEIETEIKTSSGEKKIIKRKANWHDIIRWRNENKLENILKENIENNLDQNEENKEIKIQRRIRARLNDIARGLLLLEQIRLQEEGLLVNYKWFRLRELARAKKELLEIEEKININREMLNDSNKEKDLEDTIRLEEEYRELYKEYEKIIYSSPEAYLWKMGQNLLEIKQVFDKNGTMVETPYVREKIYHILKEVEKRPVFIHGELSTGKTELAKHIARKYLSEKYLRRWEKENPRPNDPNALKEWEKRREQEREPLEIRGMRSLEKEDILSRTVLQREQTLLPEEQIKFLIEAKENFRKNVIEEAAKSIKDPQDRKEFIKSATERLEEAYMEKWRSGIVTIEKLSPIFQAMKDGRPIIIDEMNAIPHHVLIVLNDIINKKPGDIVFTPTGEQITVQDGFTLIATGNWKPEDSILYPGRAILDAAFLSRFALEEYDYLPQNIKREEGTNSEVLRKERQENELFMMMMVRILDNQLGARLPEGSIEKIKELARAARILQDVFSEKIVDKAFWAKGSKINPKDVLKENVLAYRQLFPILERWKNDGFVRPLDDYIFLEYVRRSSARPQEMKYIYNLLQTQFDFFSGEDWPRSTGESDADITAIRNYNIVRKIYGVDVGSQARRPVPDLKVKLKYYSPKEIIEEIFGPVPERKRYKKEIFEKEANKKLELQQLEQEYFDAKDDLGDLVNKSYLSKETRKFLGDILKKI